MCACKQTHKKNFFFTADICFPMKSTSFSQLRTSLDLAGCIVFPAFVKETKHKNGRGKAMVIIIVNNESWENGTTMQKSWFRHTCCPERPRIIVTQVFIMRLTFAAAAKLLQLCLTLCDPVDGSLPGSPAPGILQARTVEWVAISFPKAWKWKVKVKSLSHVCLLATPWIVAYQAPLSMGFSRQEYLGGVPFPSPDS